MEKNVPPIPSPFASNSTLGRIGTTWLISFKAAHVGIELVRDRRALIQRNFKGAEVGEAGTMLCSLRSCGQRT